MKLIRIPKPLHEVFGEKISLLEMVVVLATSTLISIPLFVITRSEWVGLPGWKTAILFLLIFDILAGFIANLTFSTNNYYQDKPRLRLLFIAIHIQPVIFALLLDGYWFVCVAVWIFTILSAYIVNKLNVVAQKTIAGSLVAIGITGILLVSTDIPVLLLIALVFYQLKVTFSFSVDQYAPRMI